MTNSIEVIEFLVFIFLGILAIYSFKELLSVLKEAIKNDRC